MLMSNFFDKSDLVRKDAENIVSDTLKNCDDGELYLEDSKSESIVLDDNKIKSSNYSSDLGFGFRAVSEEVVAYSYSNEISKESLKNSAENLQSTLKSIKGTYKSEIPKSNKKFYNDINPIEQKTLNSKLEVLNKVNDYLRKKDGAVKQVTANFLGEHKSIEIIRSGGEAITDIRPLIRFNVSVMLEKNGRKETGVYGIGGRQSYDDYLKNDNWKSVCEEAFRIASVNLESKPAPAGEMKVVLGPGWPAILIHEAIGHGLEGDFNRKKTSAFHNLMGQKVASEGVTIVDDGTIDNRRGSLTIDDEGTPTERTVLIENNYTSKGKIIGMGGSAGGLLMGVVVNQSPELFLGIIMAVPFVDSLTTNLDHSLPLTVGEFDEFGNAKENKEHFDYIFSYAPYNNIKKKDYPHILITTSLSDNRVLFDEPAKFTAKLREYKTDNNLLLLKTEMNAGHGGKSGRDGAIEEIAIDYAFALKITKKI